VTLALKLFLTPLLIALTSLAGRRWGPAVSGWLIGLPLTSGPVSVILALSFGIAFATHAAVGTLGGQGSVLIFCLAYSLAALYLKWPASAVLAVMAFFASTAVWNHFSLTLWPTYTILIALALLVIRLIPRQAIPTNASALPRWDLPARMIIATAFVIALTSFAALLGPQLSGLISPFPVFGLVLAVFAHKQQGLDAARQLLRGVALGAFAFSSFFLIVGGLLPVLGILWTYLLASVAAVTVNGLTLRLAR